MDLLEDLKVSFLNFNLLIVKIYIIYKMLVLLKSPLNYHKDNILECLFKEYNRLLFLKKHILFFTAYNDGNFKS